MKVWILAIAAVVVGVAAGLGSVWLEFHGVRNQFEPNNQPAAEVAVDPATGPKATVLTGHDFDFGVGQRNTEMSHTFSIRNDGGQPLTLEKGATSCKCTLSDVSQGKIAPGQTANIKLDWKLTTPSEMFRQTAEIHTNDLTKPTIVLSVHGKITDIVVVDPEDVVLSNISAGEEAVATFRLYGFDIPELQVVKQEFTNLDTARFFDLALTPATPEELRRRPPARCGVTATLTVKPGLPLGPINQRIRLTTNIDKAGELEVGVTGSIVSDISIVAPGNFSEKHGVLQWGTVRSAVGRRENVRLLVKGPFRHDVRLTVKEVDPADVLVVTLGEAKSINDGAVYMYPLTIEIPPGARAVNRLGSEQAKYAKILIETTHPTAKSLPIYVKFAVE